MTSMRMLVVCVCLLGAAASCDVSDVVPPTIVPYLDAKPSAVDGQGAATLSPHDPLTVGQRADFTLTFTVGEDGIVPGGYVLLQLPLWWGWSEPQDSNREAPGFVEVEPSFDDPSLQTRVLPGNRAIVYSQERAMAQGDTLTFHYRNARADKFAEAEEHFQVLVDADADGHAADIDSLPTIRIHPGPAARLVVNAPSQHQPGQPAAITVAALDPLGNWTDLPAGDYTLQPSRDGEPLPAETAHAGDGDTLLRHTFTPDREGIHFIDVTGPDGLTARSNVLLCRQGAPRLNLYFGDLHGHSGMSDGTGTPEDYFRYARDVSGLDMAALTDHADFGTLDLRGARWDRIQQAANDADAPGCFVTFAGYEWTNWTYGHRNVYYRDGRGPLLRSIDDATDTPDELWRALKGHEAMTIPHHVGGGPIATDWSIAPGPMEWLVEISSVHGVSEVYGGPAAIYRPVRGAFAQDALARGYKLGFIGSGDTHDGHPGQRSHGAVVGGLLGVYSSELSREAVWEAFRKRHTYATSGPKIILNFRVGDGPMGSEVTWPADGGPIPITLRAVCCDTIDTVEVIRNGAVLLRHSGDGVSLQALAEDPEPPPGLSWYYLRVTQRDGNMAWSSPVWVDVAP